MKRLLSKFWERLLCKHSYKFKESMMLHAGMRKMVVHKCEKCGKEKTYYVKIKGERTMKVCKYEQKYRHGLKRCLRDGSLRYCKQIRCPHFKPTLMYRFFGRGWI